MSRSYIKEVIQNLECSKKKREEIERQLISEFDIGRQRGENESKTIDRLGDPFDMAAEFNQNFSREERKQYKKEKWMKRIRKLLLIAAIAVGVIWCLLPKRKALEQSSIFDRAAVESQLELVLKSLETDDYETLQEISNDEMDVFFEDGSVSEAKTQIGEVWGERVSVGQIYAVEVTQMGKSSVVIQQQVVYENTSVTYTISFNREMEMIGLWLQ